jgi:hypothetical protein
MPHGLGIDAATHCPERSSMLAVQGLAIMLRELPLHTVTQTSL